MGQESWVQTAEKIILFRNQNRGGDAARLLEISPTNRNLIDREQAVIFSVLRFTASYTKSLYPENKQKWAWLDNLVDMLEEHQLTIEKDSRLDFMKTVIAQASMLANRIKNEAENLINK